jgi:hypothetical protein
MAQKVAFFAPVSAGVGGDATPLACARAVHDVDCDADAVSVDHLHSLVWVEYEHLRARRDETPF